MAQAWDHFTPLLPDPGEDYAPWSPWLSESFDGAEVVTVEPPCRPERPGL